MRVEEYIEALKKYNLSKEDEAFILDLASNDRDIWYSELLQLIEFTGKNPNPIKQ